MGIEPALSVVRRECGGRALSVVEDGAYSAGIGVVHPLLSRGVLVGAERLQ